ncbi:MAG TPA: Scr1 family TA system antitoxin-like transcriptional regulator [Streptomyces sp.]|uniref:Scr1 family TA system antitoxin-like transcriptional regulator n=1 Tax=Streptomyces sp. TaxID=1931 RepID=UPI002C954002|nr:Scr1 family TA system antitoxin-like transcriptional regulator [Streptomyces sp.]HWU07428.1 Scr1 family TA system antitoxin-like transcriptional regulator [Streptomyces sp.]
MRLARESDHRFAILLEETVLHYRVADDAAMCGQLEYLPTAAGPSGLSKPSTPLVTNR